MKSALTVGSYFDSIAKDYDYYKSKNSFYYKNLKKLLGGLIPKGKRVFEVGCGTGDLLVSLNPKYGYGMDISSEMIKIANTKYKNKDIVFSTKWPVGKFDYIFMSDVVEHLENPKDTFLKIREIMGKKTVFINTMANPFWEPVLLVAEKLGLKMPEGPHKRVAYLGLRNLLGKVGMKITRHDYKLLIPAEIPFVTDFANRNLEKYFKRLTFIEYVEASKA